MLRQRINLSKQQLLLHLWASETAPSRAETSQFETVINFIYHGQLKAKRALFQMLYDH